jgi:large subunit ribosomal protein L19
MANSIHWTTSEGEAKKSTTLHVGDTLRIHYRLIEREKTAGKTKKEVKVETRERIQVFEGILIAIRGSLENCMITVRHIGAGAIGVERIFPLVSPWIKKIDIIFRGKVRRNKLYYLRSRTGKEAVKLKERKSSTTTKTQKPSAAKGKKTTKKV